ncbi:DNA mismatch repair protein MutS [Patescibacteria group bacterium]|nr:DNA mismatch repair protein MutS [Patescibacteria group bacterium]
MNEFQTPMMNQYAKLKKEHPNCLLLFRLGDFYEMFFDDAKIGASVLNIALTSRSRGKDGRIPMSGIPYHALDAYLSKLVEAGYKVAICEQVGDITSNKLVEREVVRIVTPGTLLDEKTLSEKENNYIAGIHIEGHKIGLALADISTGYFNVNEYEGDNLVEALSADLSKYLPSEVVLSEENYSNPELQKVLNNFKVKNVSSHEDWSANAENYREELDNSFGSNSLRTNGISELEYGQKASAGLLGYLRYTQKGDVSHFKKITSFSGDFVNLGSSTISNLELFSSIKNTSQRGTLVEYLDHTESPMGGRMLRRWLLNPLKSRKKIEERYSSIEFLLKNKLKRKKTERLLSEVSDIERAISRLSAGLGNPRDLIRVKNSLETIEDIKGVLGNSGEELLDNVGNLYTSEVKSLSEYIEKYIVEEPPFDPKGGDLIKDGINSKLDELREKVTSSQNYLVKLEEEEKGRTKINSLKVRFNQVFGYYIEVTRPNLNLVPEDYIRKQTLVNAERFITPELKEHEEIILAAGERIKEIEYEIFQEVVGSVLNYIRELQDLSDAIAVLDCLVCFANLSERDLLCKPEVRNDGVIDIKQGRHPVVESNIEYMQFVPNDVYLDSKANQLLIITGPNMAGKSVFIRQVAVMVLMAQIGCFVPAKSAGISLVDKIFVRSGASDVISSGLSTFMVEMVETANILNNATSDSLVIMDEIGRGTSTYDGISIAWAVTEYLVSNPNLTPKTMFATHYHELQNLEEKYPDKIKNYNVAVKRNGAEPVFLHTVVRGGADHSFGIDVAKMAGVPDQVCDRAWEILSTLEEKSEHEKGN